MRTVKKPKSMGVTKIAQKDTGFYKYIKRHKGLNENDIITLPKDTLNLFWKQYTKQEKGDKIPF
jgi:hypothetical protein